MTTWLYCIFFFCASFFVCCTFIPLSIYLANKFGAIDLPSKRRVHKYPVPRLGGLAIFAGILACVVLAGVGTKYMGWDLTLSYKNSEGVNYIIAGAGAVLIFLTGVADDVKCLPPKAKLTMQIIASCITVSSGLLLNRIMNPFTNTWIEFGWFAYPLTILYLVAFSNIINLIDGLNGLSAGISAITATTLFIFSVLTNRADSAILSIAIIGACFSFLIYNFRENPKTFMGDCGSLTIGYLLGITSLLAVARTAFVISMIVPLLAAGVPIIDTLFAIIRRIIGHQPIDQADVGHIHHRLLKSGLSKKQTVLIMWGWTILLSICGIVITVSQDSNLSLTVLALALAFTIFMVIKLHLFHPVLKHHYNPRKKEGRIKRSPKYGLYNRKK